MNGPLTLAAGNVENFVYVEPQLFFELDVPIGTRTNMGPFKITQRVSGSAIVISCLVTVTNLNTLFTQADTITASIFKNSVLGAIFTASFTSPLEARNFVIPINFVDDNPTEGLSILGEPIEYTIQLLNNFTGAVNLPSYSLNTLYFCEVPEPQKIPFEFTNS